MSKWITLLWLKMNGWKTILGYVIAQLPWFAAHPMIVDAVGKLLLDSNPATVKGAEAWGNLIVQLILLTGVIHSTMKNITQGTAQIPVEIKKQLQAKGIVK